MIEADHIPAQRKGFRFQEMEDEGLIFNETTKRTIYLNDSATVIWKLCDGQRSVRAIAELLKQAYGDVEEDFETDVRETIESLLHEGALTSVPVGRAQN